MIEQRDLLLVPFPFSDQSGRKVRPVIVISNNDFNKYSDDILVVGVTSNILRDKYSIKLSSNHLERGNLSLSCYVKVENILKLDKELALKRIGRINVTTLKAILSKLFDILKVK